MIYLKTIFFLYLRDVGYFNVYNVSKSCIHFFLKVTKQKP